jgi:outer membrane receptor protein involved in Fe transport
MNRTLLAALVAAAYPFLVPAALAQADDLAGASPPPTESPEGTAVAAASRAQSLDAVTVTGTRELRPLAETPASIGIVSGKDIRLTGPTHPQQILGQIPGVAVGVTNGEGHTTAIRQPFTTGPLYLYLEDGIPVRATGFFNHNALYEVNIPAAGSVEVVRGPGTALYGSDAIGGTVNVLTRAPSGMTELGASVEAGSFGWRRLLADGTIGLGDGGLRGAANLTRTDGWRDATDYERQSANLRWDTPVGGAQLKTILGFTHIDQQTGANSPLTLADYLNDPTKNNMPIAYRKVKAARLSTQYDHESGATLVSVTPYLRWNDMDLNGTFNLSFDPRIEKSEVASVGVMAKWRRDFAGALRPRLILGLDVDHSVGKRTEDSLAVTRTGSGADTVFTGFTVGERIYDYEVTFDSLSPYVHAEVSPSPAIRLTAGLRHDSIRYRMENRIAAPTTSAGPRVYAQIPQATVDFSHWSPKLGATWSISPDASLYASYNHGFRSPSESQLFRAGSAGAAADAESRAQLALALKPIKANQFEIGVRGEVDGWSYDAVAYELVKRDDLVTQRDLASNVTTSVNAGRTRHRGVELGLGKSFARAWRLDTALSYAKHTYVRWQTATADFSGNEIEAAPRVIANTRLTWAPRAASSVQLEYVRIGSYWLEAGNSPAFGKYPGHHVLNLRARHRLGPHVAVFARVMNLADKRYADSASVSSNTPVFSPALPRAYYAGLEATW